MVDSYSAAPKDKPASAPTIDVQAWLGEIDLAAKDMAEWTTRCNKIRKLYRYDDSTRAKKRQYQIFYSNIQTLKPKVYTKVPKAVVGSRYKDGDPVVRITSTLLERGIQYNMDEMGFGETFEAVRDDFLLYARGVPRLRYEPIMVEAAIEDGLSDVAVRGPEDAAKEDAEGAAPQEILKFENLYCDFVQREDFIHPKARTWGELPWIAYRCYLTRDELVKRFPECGDKIALDASPARDADDSKTTGNGSDKATIYEIWNKADRQVIWITKGYGEALDNSPPYLKLTGFFPSPKPAYGTMTNDSLIPVPGFVHYQDQIQEINDLTARIASLTDSLKLVGFYPAGPDGEGSPQIERAMNPGVENKMIAVKSWAQFTEAGKGGAPIVWLPVEVVAKLITECVALRKQLIEDVHEITGISDIMRGETDANETASAQHLKSQFGASRTNDMKRELERVCRDVVRMAGEIIAEQFQVETLLKIANIKVPTKADLQMQMQQQMQQLQGAYQQAAAQAQQQGQPPPPPPQPPQMPNTPTVEDVEAMLRDGVMRRFRLDIETDSTVAADDAQDKADRTAFVQSISQFAIAWGPILAGKPGLAPLAAELLKFGVRAFPIARELEEMIEKTADQMAQEASQSQQGPPQPSPEDQIKLETTHVKAEAEKSKAQIGVQAVQIKAQADVAKTQMGMQQAQQSHEHELEVARQQHALDTHAAQTDHAIKMRTLEQTMQMMEQKHAAAMALKAMTPPAGAGNGA